MFCRYKLIQSAQNKNRFRLNTFPIITVAAVGKTILQAKQAAAHSAIENLVGPIYDARQFARSLFSALHQDEWLIVKRLLIRSDNKNQLKLLMRDAHPDPLPFAVHGAFFIKVWCLTSLFHIFIFKL